MIECVLDDMCHFWLGVSRHYSGLRCRTPNLCVGPIACALRVGGSEDVRFAHVRHAFTCMHLHSQVCSTCTICVSLHSSRTCSATCSFRLLHCNSLCMCALDCSLNSKKQNILTNRDVSADAISFICEHVRVCGSSCCVSTRCIVHASQPLPDTLLQVVGRCADGSCEHIVLA